MGNDIFGLNKKKVDLISKNLVLFMKSDALLSQDSANFIANWILSGPEEKNRMCYDIWDNVLKNYMPDKYPVLYRSCNRRTNGKIASFTGDIYSAYRFSDGKGLLLICDTSKFMYEQLKNQGEYKHTFFPIAELLKKEAKSENCKFSERLIDNYIKEDEYIMRVDLGSMYSCKWYS